MSNNESHVIDVFELAAKVPEDMRGVAASLASELAFMRDTLDSLKAHVATYGAVEWYENGKQACWRESPALKSYNAMVQRYSNLCKQLVSLAGDSAQGEGDELDEWLRDN